MALIVRRRLSSSNFSTNPVYCILDFCDPESQNPNTISIFTINILHSNGSVDMFKTSFSHDLKTQIPSLITGALIIVASLAWNDAITSLINNYIPQKYQNAHNAWFKVLYALVLTIIIVFIMTEITSLTK